MVSACVETGGSYANALAIMGLWLVMEATWMWLLHRTTPPGRWRLLLSLPVIAGNLATPRMFCRHQDAIMIVFAAFMTGWLTNYKILAWCLNRGVLCQQDYTALQFSAVLLTPITPAFSDEAAPATPAKPVAKPVANAATAAAAESEPILNNAGTASAAAKAMAATVPAAKDKLHRRTGGRRQAEATGGPLYMFGIWVFKLLTLGVVVWVLSLEPNWFIQSYAMIVGLYILLSSLMDGPGALVSAVTGLKVSPHFDRPWLAKSVSESWSKRWDLAAGNALRSMVFEPVVEGRMVYDESNARPSTRPKPLRVSVAILLTFAASGLVHEYIYWCMTGHTTRGMWLAFFLVQVPLQVGEKIVLGGLKKREVMVPIWLRIVYTQSVGNAVCWAFFWKPVVAEGLLDETINSVKWGVAAMADLLGLQVPAVLSMA